MRPTETRSVLSFSPGVREIQRTLDAVRDADYQGRDPGGLATVEIDGSGVVTAVRLIPTISRHQPSAIAQAVQFAYRAAEAQRTRALQDVGPRPAGGEA